MLNRSQFSKEVQPIIDWISQYYDRLEQLPVKSQVRPKEILSQLPAQIPLESEPVSAIMQDLEQLILPGITHWQHPNFHAYFPANSSIESVFAEFITAAIGAQCMVWDTSPAAAELEERMMQWLAQAVGLPHHFEGVIQDTASTATLAAILTAREVCTQFQSNYKGVPAGLRVYCSDQTHSSIDKAVRIAGIGSDNLVAIKTDKQMSLIPEALEQAILRDIEAGYTPCCVISTIGTTGTVAIDPIAEISALCQKHKVWHHVDAAYAGTVLLLPEYQYLSKGVGEADSFVFNPHKWMFTNFDCTAYFVRDVDALVNTFEITPEFLKTSSRGHVNDYRDWGIPLGRRFRALKLWFVMRSYGLKGIQDRLRHHIALRELFVEQLVAWPDMEIITEPRFNFCAFRLHPAGTDDTEQLNALNAELLASLNQSGELYLSHTKVRGDYVIRMVIGQTYVEERHVLHALKIIREQADRLV